MQLNNIVDWKLRERRRISRRHFLEMMVGAGVAGLATLKGLEYRSKRDCPMNEDRFNKPRFFDGSNFCEVFGRKLEVDFLSPHILFIIGDCVRLDVYYTLAQNLRRIACRGKEFEIVASSTQTTPSVGAMLSGRSPRFKPYQEQIFSGFDYLRMAEGRFHTRTQREAIPLPS